MQDEEQPFERTIAPLLGIDTASAATTLAPGRWRYQINAHQGKLGASTQRPGSVPVTNTPLSGTIDRLTVYRSGATEKILAFAGTKGYKYASGAWTALAGTVSGANVYDTDFTYADDRKLIADGGPLKEYNDATETINAVAPAADEVAPAPPNALASINGKGIKYIFPYNGYIWLSDGSDTWWYTKRYEYKYVPSVHEIRWLRENDYMMGPGVLFDNVVLLPMRRRWGIMLPTADVEIFEGNLYLNTVNGVIAPRSVERVTKPDGTQTIFYLSDDGVHEIFDTGFQDQGSRRYSTRGLMTNRIDFDGMGFSDAEKAAAHAYYDARLSMYLLRINQGLMPGAQRYTFAYDVRNAEWYLWTEIKATGFLRSGELYYTSELGHLCKFDATLASDWNDAAKTSGTPIDWDNITDVLMFEDTGNASYLDYLTAMARQYASKSTMDISIRTLFTTVELESALRNQIMIWGVGVWGETAWYNVDFTDYVGKPKKMVLRKRSPYFQIRFRNNKDELCELYQFKLTGRTSGG